MYPLSFPLEVLSEYPTQGGLVVDPFCGRGTTSFAARLVGRPTVGVDTNALAVVVTRAKLSNATPEELKRFLTEVMSGLGCTEERATAKEQAEELRKSHEFWTLAFTYATLVKLVHLRRTLLNSSSDRLAAPLMAVTAGALHGPLQKTKRSYLSNQAPRTFAPKPDYSVRFWKARSMAPPEVNFEGIINERIDRYFSQLSAPQPGKVVQADSRNTNWEDLIDDRAIDLVITSPPYFGMVSYSSDQWLRLWFLGGAPFVDYSSRNDFSYTNTERFAEDLRRVWSRLRDVSSDKARMVIRMGSIPSRPSEPERILEQSLRDTGWKIATMRDAGDPRRGKRQHDHFGRAGSSPAAEIDVHCVSQ
jgi:hypothetical protein